MRFAYVLLLIFVICSGNIFAQKPAWEPAPGHITLPLWPHPAASAGPEIEIGRASCRERV